MQMNIPRRYVALWAISPGWGSGEYEDQIKMGLIQSSLVAVGGSGRAGNGAGIAGSDEITGRFRAAAEAAGDGGVGQFGIQTIVFDSRSIHGIWG